MHFRPCENNLELLYKSEEMEDNKQAAATIEN